VVATPPPPKTHTRKALASYACFLLLTAGFGCSLHSLKHDTQSLPSLPSYQHIAKKRVDASELPSLNVSAKSIIVLNAQTGNTLYEYNADEKLPIASTQKLLSALVALSEGPLSELIPTSLSAALEPPSKIGLKWQQSYSRESLLQASLICSANDAATALSEAQNKTTFLKKMNALAKSYGATNSWFINPHGLDTPGQFSTARDLAKIAFHAYRNPFIRLTTNQLTQKFHYQPYKWSTLRNTNRLVRTPHFNGLKGGFTHLAQKTLVASAKKGTQEVLIVLLNAHPLAINQEAQIIWEWALRQEKKKGREKQNKQAKMGLKLIIEK